MEPPNGVEAPLVAGAVPFGAPKGFVVDDAGEKSKPPAGWKVLFWFPAPKLGAGNELLVNALFELFAGCAGGKLLVVLPPKDAPPPNIPPAVFAPESGPPPMGAVAPKPKLGVC